MTKAEKALAALEREIDQLAAEVDNMQKAIKEVAK